MSTVWLYSLSIYILAIGLFIITFLSVRISSVSNSEIPAQCLNVVGYGMQAMQRPSENINLKLFIRSFLFCFFSYTIVAQQPKKNKPEIQ